MKVLFLDHDGVLTTFTEYGSRTHKKKNYLLSNNVSDEKIPAHIRFDDFNPHCVKALNDIIGETNCEIVITSSWKRFSTLDELKSMYKIYGVSKEPIGMTRDFDDIASKDSKRSVFASYEKRRKIEIEAYLDDHKDIEYWCVVDDMDLDREDVSNFVQTDEYFGLMDVDVQDRILYFLFDNEED